MAKRVQSRAVQVLGETRDRAHADETVQYKALAKRNREEMRAAKVAYEAVKLHQFGDKLALAAESAAAKAARLKVVSKTYKEAKNPLAETMLKRYHKMAAKARRLKYATAKTKAKAKIMKAKSKMANSDEASAAQQAKWAVSDELKATTQVVKAKNLMDLANQAAGVKQKAEEDASKVINCRPACDPAPPAKVKKPSGQHTYTNVQTAANSKVPGAPTGDILTHVWHMVPTKGTKPNSPVMATDKELTNMVSGKRLPPKIRL